ncbi:DUF6919 domain-containing protein [Amycolatopsis sp. NPDC098790]|uniref:DUF6919 domain-containing protein n=1 Tax=Amycolatopsis sp. NPDC098790 TaxID=3363939 RepID=UPI0037F19676
MTELDEHGRNLAERQLWLNAEDLAGIGGLMARWLEGNLSYQPAYYGSAPDEETAELVPVLAALNRAGFVTEFSQPGIQLTNGSAQRAAVGGFCDDAMLLNLKVATFGTDLVMLRFASGDTGEGSVVVTLDEREEYTFLGRTEGPDDLEHGYGEDLSPAGLTALIDAWQIHLFDPVWGRNDLLWPLLTDTVELLTPR